MRNLTDQQKMMLKILADSDHGVVPSNYKTKRILKSLMERGLVFVRSSVVGEFKYWVSIMEHRYYLTGYGNDYFRNHLAQCGEVDGCSDCNACRDHCICKAGSGEG